MMIARYIGEKLYQVDGLWDLWYFSTEAEGIEYAAKLGGRMVETTRGEVWRVQKSSTAFTRLFVPNVLPSPSEAVLIGHDGGDGIG